MVNEGLRKVPAGNLAPVRRSGKCRFDGPFHGFRMAKIFASIRAKFDANRGKKPGNFFNGRR
jgi:hypothetical protein